MIIELHKPNVIQASWQLAWWLSEYAGVIDAGAGIKAAYKLLQVHGEGTYEVKQRGKLFKGSQLVVHRDDIEVFVMGKEMEFKVVKDKKEKQDEAKEEKAPSKSGAVDRRRARKKSNPWAK